MTDQLDLLPPAAPAERPVAPLPADTSWELDEHTRIVGLVGLAAARQALREAGRRLAA